MSHAVHRLSFGKSFPRKEDPLSGFTRTTRHANETGTYKYFLKVVPVTYTGKSSPSALKAYERKFRRESAALAIETKRKKKRLEKMRARGVEGGGGGGGGGARADQALRARIRELNRYDEALYRAANEILDERVAQLAREARDPG